MPDTSIASLRMKVAGALYDCGGRMREGGYVPTPILMGIK
jgi:hypothetical protein